MTTVIRIKRRLDEEPLDTFVLNCKRRKTDENDSEIEISTILTRTITTENEDEHILKHIKYSTKGEIEENFKSHITDVQTKIRSQNKITSKNSRYKILNLHRSIGPTTTEAQHNTDIIIVDLEANEKEKNLKELENSQYVYDLYYTTSKDFTEIDVNELISVYPISDGLVYDNDESVNQGYADDSDSNDENNWRNDYPDESDVESIGEEDMINAINKIDLNGENELSSDEGEAKFVYSVDCNSDDFKANIDEDDVNRYGEMYARFKAKVKTSDNNISEEEDEDSYY